MIQYVSNTWATVVSGLSSSKVSVCSLLIKEFCGGKAGWNDRAIFIETHLNHASKPVWPHSGIHKFQSSQSSAKCSVLCPIRNPESSILGNLQVPTPLSLPVWAFLKSIHPHLPTSSNWSLWWIEGPSIQWEERRIGLPHTPYEITHLLCVT